MRRFLFSFLFLAGLLAPAPARAAGEPTSAPPPVLTIGAQKYTWDDFLLYLQQINPRMEFGKLPPGEQQHWLDEYVAKKLLALRAREAGLDRLPEVRARLEFFADSVLAQAFLEARTEELEVSDAELESYYRAHPDEFRLPARVLLEQVIVRTPERAAALRAQLEQGLPWSRLLEAKRSDPEIVYLERGWFTRETLLPALTETALSLSPGEVSQPVATGYGFHLLRVEAQEASRVPELAAVREEARARVRQGKAAEWRARILAETQKRPTVRVGRAGRGGE